MEVVAESSSSPHQFHILAVDDSIIDRKLIERLLKTSSYQVTAVDSVSKALEFLGLQQNDESRSSASAASSSLVQDQQHEIGVNLIITDYWMPEMTGYDLLKKIKESASLRDIPVVIMSSENVPSRITRCLEEGAKEFFLKPVRLSDMQRLKSHILKKSTCKDEEQEFKLQNLKLTNSSSIINKRKAMDDTLDLSPGRTRPRITTTV